MNDTHEALKLVGEAKEFLLDHTPPRDDDGFSRAWQLAVTKLEEAMHRLQDAKQIELTRNDGE